MRTENLIALNLEPHTLFVVRMLETTIKDYRKGNTESKQFLFQGRILRNFLDDFGFKGIRVDLLREKIKKGSKLINLC